MTLKISMDPQPAPTFNLQLSTFNFELMIRRDFLKTTTAAAAGLAAWPAARAFSAQERVSIGIMGINGRGADLALSFAADGGADIAYLCDVDERAITKTQQKLAGKVTATPKGVGDFRRILDDESVDALIIAAPDHWHGPAT